MENVVSRAKSLTVDRFDICLTVLRAAEKNCECNRFNFNLTLSAAICGGELEQDSGQIQSPNYPDGYQSNQVCVWQITVAEDFEVGFSFTSFEVKIHNKINTKNRVDTFYLTAAFY